MTNLEQLIARVEDICKVEPVFGLGENFVEQLGELTVLAPKLAKALKVAVECLVGLSNAAYCPDSSNAEDALQQINEIVGGE